MLSIGCFKWRPFDGYRSTFTAEHVNVLRRAVARHYPDPHRFFCFTDDPAGLDPEITAIPLWDDHASVPNPTWEGGPSCYRRLKVFSRDFGDIVGERFVCLDIDMVITGDLRPLWNRDEDFVIWHPGTERVPLCASMFLLRTGTRSRVWDSFDPVTSPILATEKGCRGSDQGWINFVLGDNVPGWTTKDGVYSFRNHIGKVRQAAHTPLIPRRQWARRATLPLPAGARVVIFTGKPDPWEPEAQNAAPWIKQHWR